METRPPPARRTPPPARRRCFAGAPGGDRVRRGPRTPSRCTPVRRESFERELGRGDRKRQVRRDRDSATVRPMPGDRGQEVACRGVVETSRGFVEEPELRGTHEEPCEREPPALAGGKHAAGQVGELCQMKPL